MVVGSGCYSFGRSVKWFVRRSEQENKEKENRRRRRRKKKRRRAMGQICGEMSTEKEKRGGAKEELGQEEEQER